LVLSFEVLFAPHGTSKSCATDVWRAVSYGYEARDGSLAGLDRQLDHTTLCGPRWKWLGVARGHALGPGVPGVRACQGCL